MKLRKWRAKAETMAELQARVWRLEIERAVLMQAIRLMAQVELEEPRHG